MDEKPHAQVLNVFQDGQNHGATLGKKSLVTGLGVDNGEGGVHGYRPERYWRRPFSFVLGKLYLFNRHNCRY